MEEIELRGWAKFKSLAVKAGMLVSLWCEATSPYSDYSCPRLPLSLGLALLHSSHALHFMLGCGFRLVLHAAAAYFICLVGGAA